MNDYKKTISEFATHMEFKMDANKHKTGWLNEPVEWLLSRLAEEVKELSLAVAYNADVKEVVNEAADVANFAMMIADNYKYHKPNNK